MRIGGLSVKLTETLLHWGFYRFNHKCQIFLTGVKSYSLSNICVSVFSGDLPAPLGDLAYYACGHLHRWQYFPQICLLSFSLAKVNCGFFDSNTIDETKIFSFSLTASSISLLPNSPPISFQLTLKGSTLQDHQRVVQDHGEREKGALPKYSSHAGGRKDDPGIVAAQPSLKE